MAGVGAAEGDEGFVGEVDVGSALAEGGVEDFDWGVGGWGRRGVGFMPVETVGEVDGHECPGGGEGEVGAFSEEGAVEVEEVGWWSFERDGCYIEWIVMLR